MNKGLRDTPTSRVSTDESRSEHDRIFGKKKPVEAGRKSYRQTKVGLVELDLDAPPQASKTAAVWNDIQEHQSTITGEMVTTRSRHRQILRESGCVEVGNENLAKYTDKRDTASNGVREDLHKAISDYGN